MSTIASNQPDGSPCTLNCTKNLEDPGEESALDLLFLILVGIPLVPPPVGLPDDPAGEIEIKYQVLACLDDNQGLESITRLAICCATDFGPHQI